MVSVLLLFRCYWFYGGFGGAGVCSGGGNGGGRVNSGHDGVGDGGARVGF